MARCGVLGCPNVASELPDRTPAHVIELPSVGGYADDVGLAKFPRGTKLKVCDPCFSIYRRAQSRKPVPV